MSKWQTQDDKQPPQQQESHNLLQSVLVIMHATRPLNSLIAHPVPTPRVPSATYIASKYLNISTAKTAPSLTIVLGQCRCPRTH